MGVEKSRAIAVGSRPIGEADKLVTFYTREFGKLTGVAKGARRGRSKFGSALELFTYGQLVFFERANAELVSIDHFDIIRPFQPIREDLRRLGRGAWIVECLGRFSMDRDPSPALFGLLLRALHALETIGEGERVTLCFLLRALDLTGHRPRLDRCLSCGGLPARPLRFDAAAGGLLCGKCAERGRGALPISLDAVSGLRRLRNLRWDERLVAGFPQPVEREMLAIMEGYLAALIGRAPRVDRFLDQMEGHRNTPEPAEARSWNA